MVLNYLILFKDGLWCHGKVPIFIDGTLANHRTKWEIIHCHIWFPQGLHFPLGCGGNSSRPVIRGFPCSGSGCFAHWICKWSVSRCGNRWIRKFLIPLKSTFRSIENMRKVPKKEPHRLCLFQPAGLRWTSNTTRNCSRRRNPSASAMRSLGRCGWVVI